jgi:outer membrane protein TolC
MTFLLLTLLAAASGSPARPPLTLEAALAEARQANARLPVAAFEVKANEEQVRSARGQLLPRLGIQSDLQVAPPGLGYAGPGTATGEERLQLVAMESLYSGGALRANIAAAEAQVRVSHAAYRIAEKDVELEVRTRFSEVLKAQEDVRYRDEGLARLQGYLTTIRQRHAAGEGLQLDLLKTQARVASEEADREESARQQRQRELALGDLLGRDPAEPLSAAELPLPVEPGLPAPGAEWQRVPELLQGEAQVAVAEANREGALASRRPHIDLAADTGLLGPGLSTGVPAGGISQRLRNDFGASLTLSVSWPLFDFGIYSGQIGLARARAEQARSQAVVLSRQARLQWESAREDTARWYQQLELRRKALPLARDAYLSAESLYRGGAGTSLDVLDAFSNLIAASQSLDDAVLAYRVAEATALRWGTP